ncbi:DUF2889 domain-containing protein [Streptosporangium sp. G11]|uniref:DUF2889 domain-containing protein n=1 Tax=Streptosporangium sp. G11 TaxID=3436926 RepID=UPI003EBDE21D
MAGRSFAPRAARREKHLDVLPVSDTEMRVVATLRDTSTAIDDPADIEVIHDLRLEATITIPDLTIREISAHSAQQPYDQCAVTVAPVSRLCGLSVRRGYRRLVLEVLGGTLGCSHFLTLALDLSAANVLSIYLRMRAEVDNTPRNRADGTWTRAGMRIEPGLLNACAALAADSPVQRRATLAPPADQP